MFPIELLRLIFQFLEAAETNVLNVEVEKENGKLAWWYLQNMSFGESLGKW